MALEIRRSGNQSGGSSLTADRRLYLASDRETLVEEGDVRAAFLLVGAGDGIPASEAQRLGLSVRDGRVVQGAPEPTKAMPAPEDKALSKPDDKSGKPKAKK